LRPPDAAIALDAAVCVFAFAASKFGWFAPKPKLNILVVVVGFVDAAALPTTVDGFELVVV
jgi:hypothetical protein